VPTFVYAAFHVACLKCPVRESFGRSRITERTASHSKVRKRQASFKMIHSKMGFFDFQAPL
jgi:hypothetical protein